MFTCVHSVGGRESFLHKRLFGVLQWLQDITSVLRSVGGVDEVVACS